jgi:ubiquitin carboxyl-terminal hydrolase 4/11/15
MSRTFVSDSNVHLADEEFKKDLNPSNPLSHNGDVAKAYANLLHQLFDKNGMSSFAPRSFKSTIGKYGPSFSGYGQQDSQEFLGFLLDGLHEDLNRIHKKPYIEKPDSTDEMVDDAEALHKFADRCWEIHKARNDSVITDLFAGMYKSTLHCPICDKVSIIFDPFNSLTLQLPIESLWTREVFYFPFQKPPVRVEVEIDKNSNVAGLKEYLAKKLDSDPRRLVMAEVYKSKIYRLFENPLGIAEAQINQNDDIAIFELESVPTSYDPDKARKPVYTSYVFTSSHDEEPVPFDSPKADRILVPIYNRLYKPNASRHSQREFFAAPLFVVIKRQDAYDYQAILKQILGQVARLTTKDILHEDEEQSFGSNEDSDMVVTNDDDIMLSDSNVKDASVEGEDGLVDVSMQDAATESASEDSAAKDNESNIPRVLRRGTFIPPGLLSLFEVKVAKTNSATATGFSTIDEGKDFPLMEKRVLPKQDNRQGKKSMLNPMRVTENSPVSSEDELNVEAVKRSDRYGIHARFQDDDSSMETKTDSPSESDSDMLVLAADSAASKKKKRMAQKAARRKPQRPAMRLPYIRPGEAIVLDWGEGAYDALFGGDARGTDSFRGLATWHAVEKLPDPELAERRQLRNRRRQKGISLDDCLDEFGKEEILSENDAWHCPRCKEFRRASKKFELWKTPDILVMHLKRFSANRGFRDKIDAFVDFPIELDLNGRVMMPEEGESLMYDLIAVDNHYGGLGGGHYTAFAKNFVDGGWYEYNGKWCRHPASFLEKKSS